MASFATPDNARPSVYCKGRTQIHPSAMCDRACLGRTVGHRGEYCSRGAYEKGKRERLEQSFVPLRSIAYRGKTAPKHLQLNSTDTNAGTMRWLVALSLGWRETMLFVLVFSLRS